MKTIVISLLILCLSCFYSIAQIGDVFPTIKGETLEGETIEIPGDTKDKFTLVGMAYSKKSEAELNSWFEPVYFKFIYKSEQPSLFSSFAYDVHVYFIPMFTGVKAAAEKTVRKKALKNFDERLFPNILFYKGQLKPYKDALDFERKDTPYFFVINMEGKIVYATSGIFTEEKLEDEFKHVEKFLLNLGFSQERINRNMVKEQHLS